MTTWNNDFGYNPPAKGDFSPGRKSMSVTKTTLRKARKPWTCANCAAQIHLGEHYQDKELGLTTQGLRGGNQRYWTEHIRTCTDCAEKAKAKTEARAAHLASIIRWTKSGKPLLSFWVARQSDQTP